MGSGETILVVDDVKGQRDLGDWYVPETSITTLRVFRVVKKQ